MVIASTPGWLVIRQTTPKNGVLAVWPGWAFDGAALPRIGLVLRLLAWNTFRIAKLTGQICLPLAFQRSALKSNSLAV